MQIYSAVVTYTAYECNLFIMSELAWRHWGLWRFISYVLMATVSNKQIFFTIYVFIWNLDLAS